MRLDNFLDEVWVVCPRCEGSASHRLASDTPTRARILFAPRRLTCLHCGHVARWSERSLQGLHGGRVDAYFQLPLWFQTVCCGDVLWAYNRRHLQLLEDFVRAEQRQRTKNLTGWHNRSLASRLPRWMKEGKNRDQILRALHRLQER